MSQRVAVVGAGIVGLSTAWFLQEHGFDVTVHDRTHVAAGSSWGNAGWLTPALTAPLPEPAVLAYGLRAVLSPASPVYVPLRPDPRLLRFLIGFARHSTARSWGLGMRAYAPMNRRALAAFDELVAGGVEVRTEAADPFLACFRTAAERDPLLEELAHIQAAGQDVKFDVLDGEEASAADPGLSSAITSAVRLHGQRYLDPPVFLDALAAAVRDRGGRILEGAEVTAIEVDSGGVAVLGAGALDGDNRFASVVIANGAWLSRLASKFGVRRLVQAGRGYSFSVSGDRLPRGPVYFPTQRVACTPLATPRGPRLRVAGMMEFRAPEAALDPRRIDAIVDAVRPLLSGVDLDGRDDEWVGARPCTSDGLPLIGATSSPRVFVAGGHGMWGIALGPLTGQLLAGQIARGITPTELVPFDPLR
ncbi:NAD(P)/FAD-dependent oxidoreductase [Nocardioides piscis]|uniref:FAD-dependent oxidoreductase n=1 Tax=Nocardioides piscis TaxID=2714938 RepID=A0A6G7YCH2_9ACTN|nr:FAD-dependent oxidoreductase [Nocardioides piscis]QIK74351.1 FAD-dependent oxidoreductase [Nocardioides piscis]